VSTVEHRFLVLAPTGNDAAIACRVLTRAGLEARRCGDIDELCRCAGEGAAGLLLAEEALAKATLDRLGLLLAGQPPWSDLPVLVFTSAGTDPARIAGHHGGLLPLLGNVTLVDRPLRVITLISAVRAALRSRLRQYQSRAALADQERAVRQRDQFLAMLGHELRNPLAAIYMATELMERRGEASQAHAVVRRQTAHLTRLVDDLLDVARVTAGKLVLHRAQLDLRDLVERILQGMQPELAARQIAVATALPADPVVVDVDQVRIEQVLSNLIGNAIKYSSAGGRIDLAVRAQGGCAELEVRDQGVGLAPEMLEHIFELFAQVDDTLERARGGLGIGLTLVRRLLELHGGSIEARSAGLDQGSTFIARVPLAQPRPAAVRPAEPAAPASTPGFRLLVVEDHADSRELLQSLLAEAGHHVATAADGRAGVDAALATRPDVMVVDIGLPRLDGYGVAREVRAALGEDVYLIALTGYGQPEDRRRAMEAGFDVHLTKPVDAFALLDLLARTARGRAAG
jgi:signal transduction histidine kinase/ActR/RegA family two-component response regulator